MNEEFSVIIPCLNEEKTISVCVKKALEVFRETKIPAEVIVVDNGSIDKSPQIAQDAGARVIIHKIKGYGNALKRGVKEAQGKFIIMGDGDNTYDFSDIKEFIRLLQEGADFVIGNRFNGKIHRRAMPKLHRWVGTPFITWLINIAFHAGISDVNCGLRGFKKESIEKLNLECAGMEFASEMIIKAARKKLVINETPVNYYPSSPDRISHLNSFKDGWRHLRFILRHWG